MPGLRPRRCLDLWGGRSRRGYPPRRPPTLGPVVRSGSLRSPSLPTDPNAGGVPLSQKPNMKGNMDSRYHRQSSALPAPDCNSHLHRILDTPVEVTSNAVEVTSNAVEVTSNAVEVTSNAVEVISNAVEVISNAVEVISNAV